jgi:hypothetical protein
MHNVRVQISQGLSIDVPNHLLYFLHVQRHVQKARAPDGRYIHLLILSARAAPRTKSKGLPRYAYLINQVFKSFCSSVDIIIDGLVRLRTPWACLLVFIKTRGWARDHHRANRPRSTQTLHWLTTDQLAPHHYERIDKSRSTIHDQYTDPGFSHLLYLKYLYKHPKKAPWRNKG